MDERCKVFDNISYSQNVHIDQYKKWLHESAQENASLRLQLANKTKEMSEMINKPPGTLQTLYDSQLTELKHENSLLEEELQRLYEALVELETNNSQLTEEVSILKKIPVKTKQSEELREELSKAHHKLKLLTIDQDELKEQRDQLLITTSDLKSEVDNLQGQIRVQRNHIEGLENQLKLFNQGEGELAVKAKRRIDEQNQEVEKWMSRLRQAESEKRAIQERIEEMSERNLDLQESITKVESELVETRKVVGILEDKNKYLSDTVDNLRVQIKEFEMQSSDINKKEGQITALELRHKELLEQITRSNEIELKRVTAKYSSLIEGMKSKHNQLIEEKDTEISDKTYQLTQTKLKLNNIEMENRALRDLEERIAPIQSAQEQKDLVIYEQNKKLSEIKVQLESLKRQKRDLELKRHHEMVGPSIKDDAYRSLEQELTKIKVQSDHLRSENVRLSDTLKRKDKSLQQLEEQKLETMKKSDKQISLAQQQFLNQLAEKDQEISDSQRAYREFKTMIERKLRQHEEVEEQLLQHSQKIVANYEARIRGLEEENTQLREKFTELEQALV